MTSNPKAALRAILQGKMAFGEVTAYPLTIQRQALLEAINSPFAGLSDDWSIDSITPSLFVFTQSADELDAFGADDAKLLKLCAFEWFNANEVNGDVFNLLFKHAVSQMKLLGDLASGSQPAGKTSTNGWLAGLLETACNRLGQDMQRTIRETPLAQLLLGVIQWHRTEMISLGKDTLTLEDKEAIDKMVAAENMNKRKAKESKDDIRRGTEAQA